MDYKNYFNWLSSIYGTEINHYLRNVITAHFNDNLNIYAEDDLYEQSQKIIQNYSDKYLKINYIKLYK